MGVMAGRVGAMPVCHLVRVRAWRMGQTSILRHRAPDDLRMSRLNYRIELRPDWREAPLAFWVHKEIPAGGWRNAASYEPPAPAAIGRSGFRFLVVTYGAQTLEFSSNAQVDHFVDVLSRNPLPTTRRLSSDRGTAAGPNSHWLSRLPASLKSAKQRTALVETLRKLPPDAWG